MSFTIDNPNASVALTSVGFIDTLPNGLVVSTPNGIAGSCGGGVITATAGGGGIGLTGATLAAGASCTFRVNVTATKGGPFTNMTGNVFSSNGGLGNTASAQIQGGELLVRYAANLQAGDSVINITNTGANGASPYGPGFGAPAGNLCVNVYTFSPDEQLVSCCSCLVTPNGLVHLTANNDLVSNTLTGIRPNSIVVKLAATGAGAGFGGTNCNNSAALAGTAAFPLASGALAWGTTLHSASSIDPPPGPFSITETPFSSATLSAGELAGIAGRCSAIIGNGSTFGQCSSCRQGTLGAIKQ